jgi:hypothetical protein
MRDEKGGTCGMHWRDKNPYKLLVRNPEGKRLLRRPRHRWEVSITTGLREIGWEVMDWIHLDQDRDQWWVLVKKVMNLQVP